MGGQSSRLANKKQWGLNSTDSSTVLLLCSLFIVSSLCWVSLCKKGVNCTMYDKLFLFSFCLVAGIVVVLLIVAILVLF